MRVTFLIAYYVFDIMSYCLLHGVSTINLVNKEENMEN